MEILGTTQSLKQARRIQDEIAIQGEWRPTEVGEHSIVYAQFKDGTKETLTIEKRGTHSWAIIKTVEEVKW